MFTHSALILIYLVLHVSYLNYARTDTSFEACAKNCRKDKSHNKSDDKKDPERRPLRIGDFITPQDFYEVAKHLMQDGGDGNGIVSSASRPEELADNLFEKYFLTQRRIARLKGLDLSGLDGLQELALQNGNNSQSGYGYSEYCKYSELMSRKADRAYLEYLKHNPSRRAARIHSSVECLGHMARRRPSRRSSSEYKISRSDMYYILPAKKKHFSFEVRAYRDIYIALLPKPVETAKPIIEVVIGYSNNRLCLVKWNGRIKARFEHQGILDSSKFINLNIAWDDNSIKAEQRGHSNPLFTWQMDLDDKMQDVTFVGIKGRIKDSVWKIEGTKWRKTKTEEYHISRHDKYYIFPAKNTHFNFKVRAYRDIYIALLPKPVETAKPKIEVVIGYSNNRECLVKWNGRVMARFTNKGILYSSKFIHLSVGWRDNSIKVDDLDHYKPIFTWQMDQDVKFNMEDVQFVGVKGQIKDSVWQIDVPDQGPDSEEATTQIHRKVTTPSDDSNSDSEETTTPSDNSDSDETTTRMHRKTTTPSDDPDPDSEETTTQMHRKTTTPSDDPDSEETTTQMHQKTTRIHRKTTTSSDDPDSEETTTHMDRKTTTPSPDPEETTTQMHRKTTTPSDDTPDPDPHSEETTTQIHQKTSTPTTSDPDPHSEETTTQMHQKTTTPSDYTSTPHPDPHSDETTTQMSQKTTNTDDDDDEPYRKWDIPTNIYITADNKSTEYFKVISPTGEIGFVVVFQILAVQDGYVMLTRNKIWNGIKIHLCESGRKSTVDVSNIAKNSTDIKTCPNKQEYLGFWVTWNWKNVISVGYEGNKEPFMTTTVEGDILPLNYITFGCDHYPCSWKIKGFDGKQIKCQELLPWKHWTPQEFMTSEEEYRRFPVFKKSISFKVHAAGNAIVTMTSSPSLSNPMIEVTFGKDKNTKTSVKKDNDTKTEITAQTPQVLNPKDYVGFWITWKDNGHLEVGHEGDKDNFIHFENPEPFDIKYVEVRTLLSFGWWLIKVNDGNKFDVPISVQLLADEHTGTGPSQLDEDVKKILDDHASLIKKSEKNSIESIGSYFDRLIL